MADAIQYPGIVPVMQYKYDMSRAGYAVSKLPPQSTLGDFMWPHQSLYLCANVLYGIAKYVDNNGNWGTVDGGLLFHTIYDFCGGVIASSASVLHFGGPLHAMEDAYNPRRFRRYLPSPKESRSAKVITAGRATKFSEYSHMLPDLAAYTGKEHMTSLEASDVMTKSLGAALVTASRAMSRRGIFAYDLVVRGRTKPVLEAMHGDGLRFQVNAEIRAWPGQDPNFAPHGEMLCPSQRGVQRGVGTFACGPSYINSNTGHRVQASQLLWEEKWNVPWVMPAEEAKKFNMELAMMCPQGLFHN